MHRFLRIFGIALLISLLVMTVSIAYFLISRGPKARAQAAMQTTDQVVVTSGEWEVFSPQDSTPTTGMIFYPGAFASPKAYAEPAHAIAAKGYLVVLVPMPLGMAALAPDRATEVQAAFPDIALWVIAGHSQGGSYAARYAFKNPNNINGLVLWAGRPLGNDDLSSYEIPVLSINGSLDSRRSPKILETIKMRLPADAVHLNIEGGTHEYFGDYGSKLDDAIAEKAISHGRQTEIVVQSTVEFLAGVSDDR